MTGLALSHLPFGQHPATSPPCPVCATGPTAPLLVVDARRYHACPRCEARFLDPADHPTLTEERAQYSLHRNETDDPRYRAFLGRLATPLIERLPPGAEGLDFGCGPGPALVAMLAEAGHPTVLYDPAFFPDKAALSRTYDFVVCTETMEHFHRPAEMIALLFSLVRPGGWLGIMTCFQTDDVRFAGWWYRKDPTHVVFYREATLRHLAAEHGWTCEIPRKDVALMRRPMDGAGPRQ